jgi:hypothetical protein
MNMKQMNVTLPFFIIVIALNSCIGLPGNKTLQKKGIRGELAKYSDALDLSRTRFDTTSRWYNYFGSSSPYLGLHLYLRPGSNNRETVIRIRDGLIAYFDIHGEAIEELRKATSISGGRIDFDAFRAGKKDLQERGIYDYPPVRIEFLYKEASKTKIFYRVWHSYSASDMWDEVWFTNNE